MPYVDDLRGVVVERMKEVRRHMRQYQDVPLGTRKRTEREVRRMFRRLADLPEAYRESLLGGMAARAGHYDGEEEACEWCRFLAKHVSRR